MSKAFKIRRERRGLSIRAVSRISGVSQHIISRFEEGGLNFSCSQAKDKLSNLNKKWIYEEH